MLFLFFFDKHNRFSCLFPEAQEKMPLPQIRAKNPGECNWPTCSSRRHEFVIRCLNIHMNGVLPLTHANLTPVEKGGERVGGGELCLPCS